MSELQTTMPATSVAPGSRATIGRGAPAALQTCLVVTTSAPRAQLWVRAAHQEHWATIVCSAADDALRQSIRQHVDLALVDLQSAPSAQASTFRTLVERLAARDGPLLAVFGKPDDASGEVWSRQLGVWMYLPGFDSQCDIGLLCAEARSVLNKLAAPYTAHQARGT